MCGAGAASRSQRCPYTSRSSLPHQRCYWTALNSKGDRLPIAARWKLPTASEELAPAPVERRPAREIVQLGPTVMAIRTVSHDVCERHHLKKIWVNKWKWRCR
jgi:hypothetical protein